MNFSFCRNIRKMEKDIENTSVPEGRGWATYSGFATEIEVLILLK